LGLFRPKSGPVLFETLFKNNTRVSVVHRCISGRCIRIVAHFRRWSCRSKRWNGLAVSNVAACETGGRAPKPSARLGVSGRSSPTNPPPTPTYSSQRKKPHKPPRALLPERSERAIRRLGATKQKQRLASPKQAATCHCKNKGSGLAQQKQAAACISQNRQQLASSAKIRASCTTTGSSLHHQNRQQLASAKTRAAACISKNKGSSLHQQKRQQLAWLASTKNRQERVPTNTRSSL
jgi:hypothetical protein